MATGLEDGKIYLLETAGDLGAKTNWIVAGSGDPDTIDTEQFTEGLTLCKFSFPMKFVKRGKTGMVPSTASGGLTGVSRTANKFYNAIIMGTTATRAAGYLIGEFLMDDRHHVPVSATFKDYFLVVYYGTNDHEPFTNVANSRLSYAPGVVTDFEIAWRSDQHINLNVRLNWWSAFTS